MADPNNSAGESLLRAPLARPGAPGRRWAYTRWGRVAVSLFVAYHLAAIGVGNLPYAGFSKDLRRFFDRKLETRSYTRATGSVQSWTMFAPNPMRQNLFVRIYVEDMDGELHDMGHDNYGRRSTFYWKYDHMAKINVRLIKKKNYRRHYAAWVCREWERTHRGRPAKAVHLVQLRTVLPRPGQGFEAMLFDPDELELTEQTLRIYRCKTTKQAQLPPNLRERYGFWRVPEGTFVPREVRTWVDDRGDDDENADSAPEDAGH